MLDQLLQQQSKQGVALNPSQIARIPLNAWYQQTNQLQNYNLDPRLYTDRAKLLETYGRYVSVMTRCCSDGIGRVRTDYAGTLLAARYANTYRECPYLEKVILNTTLYASGSADIYAKIKLLEASAAQNKGRYYPVFRQNGELYQTKDQNDLTTMTLMAYITKPDGLVGFIISAYDVIKQSYLEDLLGWNDKQIARAHKKGIQVRFMPDIPEMWELKLAPHIFSFDYGMIDKNLIKSINDYKAGKLLNYRKGSRGRKPITQNPYAERIYPAQHRVLSERLEAFVTQANSLNLQGKYNIYYATPYYIAIGVPFADRALFRDILNSVYARQLFNITNTTISNGEFL